MTKQVSNHSHEWIEPEKLSFTEFNILVRRQVMEVIQSREHVEHAYDIFSSRGGISSDECDYLFSSLHTMSTSICTFNSLFEVSRSLPPVIVPLYHPLAAELAASEKLIKRTMQITRNFSAPDQPVSSAVVKQHYTIIRNLEELLEACEEIKMRSQSMLDQARFQGYTS
jgi:hypothetical protein